MSSTTRTGGFRLRATHAWGRFLTLLTLALAVLVTGVGVAAHAAPEGPLVFADSPTSVVVVPEPSMVQRAVLGSHPANLGNVQAQEVCNPDDPDCWAYQPPANPDSLCTRLNLLGGTTADTLPVHRWGQSTAELHSRLGAKAWDDMIQKINRSSVQQTAMGIGNAAWAGSVAMTDAAGKFCIGDTVGRQIDTASANLAQALLVNTGALVAVLVVTLLGILLRAARGGYFNIAALGRMLLAAGLFAVMLNGAMNTTSASYGTGSPGWIVSKVNQAIANTAGLAGNVMVDFGPGEAGEPNAHEQWAANNPLHCNNYVALLGEKYQQENLAAGIVGTTVAPRALNSIWLETGLQAYLAAQYGASNAYGAASFCHRLETVANVPVGEHQLFTSMLMRGATQAPWYSPSTGIRGDIDQAAPNYLWRQVQHEQTDVAGTFWAVCAWDGANWVVAPGWGSSGGDADRVHNPAWDERTVGDGHHGRRYATTEGCAAAWGSSWDGWGSNAGHGSFFNFRNPGAIEEGAPTGLLTAQMPGVSPEHQGAFYPRQFLNTHQGFWTSEGTIASLVYVVVATILLLLFGAISMVILLAKLAILPLLLLTFIVAITSLFLGRSFGPLVSFAKLLLGLSIIAWGAGLLLGVIAALTRIINSLGAGIGMNLVMIMVWAGLAPILAVWLLKFTFSKVLKMPDPLSVKGVKQYARGAEAMGGAAMDRIGQSSRAFASRMTGTLTAPEPALAGGGAPGAISTRGTEGGHSAGRGRAGSMSDLLERQATQPAKAGGGAGTPAPAQAGGVKPAEKRAAGLDKVAGGINEAGYAKVGEPNAPGRTKGELAQKALGASTEGAAVERASAVREGRKALRADAGGRARLGLQRFQQHQAAIRAKREQMGFGQRQVDRLAGGLRHATSGKVAGAAAVASVGAAMAGAAALAPVAGTVAAGAGAVALVRHARDRRSGGHQVRKAMRDQQALAAYAQVAQERRLAEMAQERASEQEAQPRSTEPASQTQAPASERKHAMGGAADTGGVDPEGRGQGAPSPDASAGPEDGSDHEVGAAPPTGETEPRRSGMGAGQERQGAGAESLDHEAPSESESHTPPPPPQPSAEPRSDPEPAPNPDPAPVQPRTSSDQEQPADPGASTPSGQEHQDGNPAPTTGEARPDPEASDPAPAPSAQSEDQEATPPPPPGGEK